MTDRREEKNREERGVRYKGERRKNGKTDRREEKYTKEREGDMRKTDRRKEQDR